MIFISLNANQNLILKTELSILTKMVMIFLELEFEN